jgi:acetyl-CoA acetyltransferase
VDYGLNGKVAIVGLGETRYYKRGASPLSEFLLVCEAVLNAAGDAGIDVREIDGFASYSGDRTEPTRLAAALGCHEIAFANMFWGGGGGGCAGAVGNAAAAVRAGYAKYVVAYRGLAQGQFGRFGQARAGGAVPAPMSYVAPYGVFSPAQHIALRTRTFMERYSLSQGPLAGIALASYAHAQFNPRAIMYGRPLTREDYDNSRWIAEPFHLFDCCQENDGAAAVIVTTTERARDLRQRPVNIMAAAQGSETGFSLVAPTRVSFGSANFPGVARRLYQAAGIGPEDVDVAQVYENFTGGTLMSMIEHGLCAPEEAETFCTMENLTAPAGRMPLNTSGGNLAECYMHGLELVVEAARQVRGESTAQVPGVKVSLVAAGPVTAPVSSLLLSV